MIQSVQVPVQCSFYAVPFFYFTRRKIFVSYFTMRKIFSYPYFPILYSFKNILKKRMGTFYTVDTFQIQVQKYLVPYIIIEHRTVHFNFLLSILAFPGLEYLKQNPLSGPPCTKQMVEMTGGEFSPSQPSILLLGKCLNSL